MYNPTNNWIAVSASRIFEIYEIKKYIQKSLDIRLESFSLGENRTDLPKEKRPTFWYNFLKYIDEDKNNVISNPKLTECIYVNPTDRRQKERKGRKEYYNKLNIYNEQVKNDLEEVLSLGMWLEGVKGTIHHSNDKNSELHIYIRDYKRRTTFSILNPPKDITLEDEINILIDLFDLFVDYVKPWVNTISFQKSIDEFIS